MNERSVMLPPPGSRPPGALPPGPESSATALACVAWRAVPEAVAAELHYLLALRCRKSQGPCFCGTHVSEVDPTGER